MTSKKKKSRKSSLRYATRSRNPKKMPKSKSNEHQEEEETTQIIEDPHHFHNQNPQSLQDDLQVQNPNKMIPETNFPDPNLDPVEEPEAPIENPSLRNDGFSSRSPKMVGEHQVQSLLVQEKDLGLGLGLGLEEAERMSVSPSRSSSPDHRQQSEGMMLSPTLICSPKHDSITLDLVSDDPPSTAPKRALKKKKPMNHKYRKTLNVRQRAAMEKKVQLLRENLQPIRFVPTKTLGFSKHESLLKRLGLWDFAHIEFDREMRHDLLVQLIANYNPTARSSMVNEIKIMVNRADLARALKLPVKKDKVSSLEPLDLDAEVLSEESMTFLDEFVSNWILLHEDTWMMPDEVLACSRHIKERQPQKIDWAGLIWFMVERELAQASKLNACYYASHLQCLIRTQKNDLLKEEPKQEVLVEEEDSNVDEKTSNLEVFEVKELENQHIELTLGQDRNEDEKQVKDEDIVDFQECKGPGESSQWFLGGKSNLGEHGLRRCENANKVEDLDDPCVVKDEQEEEMYDLSSKCNMERLASADLLQAMENTDIPYAPSMQLHEDNSREFIEPRSTTHMDPGGPSMFGNACKRELSHDDDDVHHNSFNDNNKRLRRSGSWDNKQSEFDVCMEQMNNWMAKARMLHEAKEAAVVSSHMNQEVLVSELHRRENMIADLNKTRHEEIQKRDLEIYKLEHELRLMSNLLQGYRTALKENRRAFSEYIERYPQPEEPLYKDVPGSGGLVLSTMELEKQRLEQEEEERLQGYIVEQMIEEFQQCWFGGLEESREKFQLLDNRLQKIEEEFRNLKGVYAQCYKKKTQGYSSKEETQGCSPKEETQACPPKEETQGCSSKEETQVCSSMEDTQGGTPTQKCPKEETQECPKEECISMEETQGCNLEEEMNGSTPNEETQECILIEESQGCIPEEV